MIWLDTVHFTKATEVKASKASHSFVLNVNLTHTLNLNPDSAPEFDTLPQ
jgi:hypothetical protein